MTLQDADYPERLRQLPDPPLALYIRGRAFAFDEEAAVYMVGAREATPMGSARQGGSAWSWPGAGPWWCLAWPRASIRPASRAL